MRETVIVYAFFALCTWDFTEFHCGKGGRAAARGEGMRENNTAHSLTLKAKSCNVVVSACIRDLSLNLTKLAHASKRMHAYLVIHAYQA